MNSKIENFDLHDAFFTLKKHIALIIIATFLCGGVGFAISKFLIAPQYQAEATLIVNASSESKNAVDVYNAVQLSQKEVDTYAIVIKNNTILNQVIQDLKLDTTKEKLSGKITVAGVGSTEVIDLKVKDEDAKTAKAIADDIIKIAPSEIMRTVKAGSVEVISYPETSQKPVSPDNNINAAIGSAIGLILSILASFFADTFDSTFTCDDDVQKYLTFTVVGVIPNVGVKSKVTGGR